jgi:hypothetical protein
MILTLLFAFVLAAAFPAAGATWYVDDSVPESGTGVSWQTAFKTIQGWIDASAHGDTVIVAEGTYVENVHFRDKNITLTSTDPLNPDVVAGTIIDGNKAGSVVTFSGTEEETCVLSGFTIRNGKGDAGGGICGAPEGHTNATVTHNVITGNSADSSGGGVAFCDGQIRDNVVADNFATYDGGGLYGCDGPIENSMIERNRVVGEVYWEPTGEEYPPEVPVGCRPGTGGGLAHCDGLIQGNRILHNLAGVCQGWGEPVGYGGGLAQCAGTIRNNTIVGNGACGELWTCIPSIPYACLPDYYAMGGGLYDCHNLIGNTIVWNSTNSGGGGVLYCRGIILNCMIWGNTSAGAQVYDTVEPTYSCIEGWTQGGEGNIAGDPLFADPDGPNDAPCTFDDNDYRLLPDSPCIDAGKNEEWMWVAPDLDANPRIWRGRDAWTVDMGAYERGSSAFTLGTSLEFADFQARLTWNSRPGDNYTVWSCPDLGDGSWGEEATVPSQGETMSWTDLGTGKDTQKFYRIEISR